MQRIFVFLLASASFFSCSEFGRVLKSDDVELKYAKAIEYTDSGECYKALPLLEELMGLCRGTDKAEKVFYYYCNAHFCVEDYYLAGYYYKQFTRTYPTSTWAEDCLYHAALCSQRLSPEFSLDQEETRAAIGDFQLFLDRYPGSQYRDTCNYLISKLNTKLERKEFEVCRLYVKTGKYKSGAQSLKDFLKRHPASDYKEEAMFLIIKSNFEFASNSVVSKQAERYAAVTESFATFAAAFPESDYMRDAESFRDRSQRQLDRLKSSTTQASIP
jgi:outer membrane protein assembly factor BamD